jgi:hypothetical protein
VSRRAHIQTMLGRTSRTRREAGLLPAPTGPELGPCSSLFIPSPIGRCVAWWCGEDDGEETACFTHFLLLEPKKCQATDYSSTDVRLHRHPERHRVLQTSVSVKRLSPVFPSSPSVTRFGAYPAPLRHIDVLLRLRRPAGLGFQTKNLPRNIRAAAAQSAGEIFSSEPPQKAHLGLGSGGPSRRFAQECPEGNPGKYKQGEIPWHSTKTKSL